LLADGAGRFKETRNGALLEAVINLTLSIALTMRIGLEGVLLATLIAGIIRTTEYAVFCFKHILYVSRWHIAKHYFILCVTFAGCYLFGKNVIMTEISNYAIWAVNAAVVTAISICIVGVISLIFYRDQMRDTLKRFCKW